MGFDADLMGFQWWANDDSKGFQPFNDDLVGMFTGISEDLLDFMGLVWIYEGVPSGDD